MKDWFVSRTSYLSLIIGDRKCRIAFISICYLILTLLSIWLAYQLRFDFFQNAGDEELKYRDVLPFVIIWLVPFKGLALLVFRQYSGLLSYFGTPDLFRLAKAVIVSSAILGVIRLQFPIYSIPPRGVILIDFFLSFLLLAGFRVACRTFREILVLPEGEKNRGDARRLGIIGAGDVGASLAKELLNKQGLGRIPVAFFDDDPQKLNTRIHDIPVMGPPENLLESGLRQKLLIEEIAIALPSAPAKRIGEIVKIVQGQHLQFTTVPSLHQMATGKVRVSHLRPVEIQDLLGRASVSVESEEIGRSILGKVVMITGAGGSIGSELCRQVSGFNPRRLLLVEQSEYLLYLIEQELTERGVGGTILPLVANVLDKERMREIFDRQRPDVVFHAAALKHVPMMENQPGEAVKVNFRGTAEVASFAMEFEVGRFILISTDKAINPTSVMGATKRLAEMYVQALAASDECKTAFMAVRFGNVLGSSGSVIPTFKKQIEMGGPVKVTHPEVTRYFMTIPEAVGLVLQSGALGEGGEIFVLDMGEPVKIVDLARQLIELSGFRPDEDIEMEFVGLRPGEKLFEELQHHGENILETEHPKIMRFVSEPQRLSRMETILEELCRSISTTEQSQVKLKIKETVTEYKPFLN